MKHFGRFADAIADATAAIRDRSHVVRNASWQGVDVSEKPEMQTHEVLNYSFGAPVWTSDLAELAADVRPNLPWADEHFLERVGGEPLNPGVQWARWPYAKSADRFRDERGQFTHTYPERYWPRWAGFTQGGLLEPEQRAELAARDVGPHHGVRYEYGDLDDVVTLLRRDPTTRQAFLPVWFPEDTGARHGGRLPCSIGYHFIQREGFVHVVYWLRSCDLVRHFRDDVYLTARLLLWVVERLGARPGTLTMHVTSLHIFRADRVPLFGPG